jgi:membrane dipeptidase
MPHFRIYFSCFPVLGTKCLHPLLFDCAYLSQRYADAAKPIMAELRPRFQEAMKIGDPAAREAAIDKLQEVSAAKLPPATLSR